MQGRSNNFRDDDNKAYAGFELERVCIYRDGEFFEFKLFLPSSEEMRDHLNSRKSLALEEAERQEAIANEKRIAAKEARNLETAHSPPLATRKIGDLDPSAERQALSDRNVEDQLVNDGRSVAVYNWDEPLKLIEHIKSASPDKETLTRNTELFKRLRAKGNLRMMASHVDLSDQLNHLEYLRESQPHFGAVIDLVRQQMLLANAQGKPLHLPPILLFGEPGVGKTHFTQVLAGALNTTIRRQAFDSSTTDAALMGSDKHWSNTTYGIIFELICLGDCANPIVLLDEIDKASSSVGAYSYRDPLAPLHSLLESVTSSKVRDSSVGIEFDASHIFYVATANDPTRVPMSLRSRFVEFHIEPPAGAHALQVAKVIATAVHEEMALPAFEPVSSHLVKMLAHLSAREQGQSLRRAFASAIANGRNFLIKLDLPLEVLLDYEPAESRDDDKPEFFH